MRESETRMSYRKEGLRVFGVCLAAVLGLMAVSAAGAQAQTGWLESGAFITATKTINATIHPLKATAPVEKHMLLSTTTLGANVKILCENLAVDDGLIFANEKAEGLASLLFSACQTFLNGALSAVCKPTEPITVGVKFHALLHNALTYLLFEPEVAGTPFVKIKFPNEECLISPERSISGSFVVECLTEDLKSMEEASGKPDLCLSDLTNHLIREVANQKLFGEKEGLTFNGAVAKLEGIAKVFLISGNKWAVHI